MRCIDLVCQCQVGHGKQINEFTFLFNSNAPVDTRLWHKWCFDQFIVLMLSQRLKLRKQIDVSVYSISGPRLDVGSSKDKYDIIVSLVIDLVYQVGNGKQMSLHSYSNLGYSMVYPSSNAPVDTWLWRDSEHYKSHS